MLIRLGSFTIFTVAGVCLALAQTPVPKNPLGTGPQVVAEGHAAFNNTCTACHGMDGGEGERAPALVGDRRFFRLSETALYDVVKHGIPGTAMPPMSLPDDNIWKIVVFIRAMRSSASEADVPGDVAHGKAVFEGKGGCGTCHMINGVGGTIGPDLSDVGGRMTLKRMQDSLSLEGPIPSGYQPIKAVTRKGETIEGIAKNEDGFSVQVLDYRNQLHLLDRSELKQVTESDVSLMPHHYDKTLTQAEYKDLLAMLAKQTSGSGHRKAEGEGEAGR